MHKLLRGRPWQPLNADRTSHSPFWMLLPRTAVLLSLGGVVFLSGCGSGGGGGDPDSTPTPTPTSTLSAPRYVTSGFDLVWAVRSRAVTSPVIPTPASASSVRVTLRGAAQDGGDVSIVMNRRQGQLDSYSEHTDFSRPVRVTDSLKLEAQFYTDENGTGSIVGEASALISILADGSGVGTISASSRIATTKVLPHQSVLVYENKDIDFEVRDSNGALIPVARGAAFLTVAPADTKHLIIVNGTGVVGGDPGSASVTVSVDGTVSAPEIITISTSGTIAMTPSAVTLNALSYQSFAVKFSDFPYDKDVVWSVREGEDGGSIFQNGVYTAPARRGVFHIDAVSVFDPVKRISATVTVSPFITVDSAADTLTLRQQKAFTASVIGLADTGVTWGVQEGASGGTVTPGGVYTAPDLPGTYHLVATAREDTSIRATITITVQAGSGTVIIE